MGAAKHTPGPWKNHGRQSNAPGLPHSAVAANTLLARVYSEAYGDHEQEKANADLIAAAPDLLAELEKAHLIIRLALNIMTAEQKEQFGGWTEANGVGGEGVTRANEREAVIAKATSTTK